MGCGSSVQLEWGEEAATHTRGGTRRHPSQRALHTETGGLGIPQAKGAAAEQLHTGERCAQIYASEGHPGFLNEDSRGGGVWRMEGERPLATAAIQKKGKGPLASRGQLTQEIFRVCVFKRDRERPCMRPQRGWGGGGGGEEEERILTRLHAQWGAPHGRLNLTTRRS